MAQLAVCEFHQNATLTTDTTALFGLCTLPDCLPRCKVRPEIWPRAVTKLNKKGRRRWSEPGVCTHLPQPWRNPCFQNCALKKRISPLQRCCACTARCLGEHAKDRGFEMNSSSRDRAQLARGAVDGRGGRGSVNFAPACVGRLAPDTPHSLVADEPLLSSTKNMPF